MKPSIMKESPNPPVFAATAHDFSGSEEAMEMDDATVPKPAKISGFSADEAMELLHPLLPPLWKRKKQWKWMHHRVVGRSLTAPVLN